MAHTHHHINYIEIPTKDLESTKSFFALVFGWTFQDFGPDYSSFLACGVDGGFFTSEQSVSTVTGSPLIVIYSQDLEATLQSVESAGGKVVKPIFSFPGGRRFHFEEPSGNEYAVWSE
ncbi:VOC family protein [Marinibactrum halimedae]|uniref:Glyoxalase n=1 Tax=Marinibactrum halimedae TaxID=1444977 RepID=A0AA37T4N1_9GAMM|nr:VOC family protein [Marinibactrum halimedae]MCD9460743.1 VOC family protein [Marinibactrum halimedae]GLS26684.1 glyoxalase [Marinibactrum halimedae]